MKLTKINFSVEAGVARIKMNSPENYNAMNPEFIGELLTALERCHDKEIRVVVLSATGKAFCAGGDIKFMEQCLADNRISDFFPTVEKAGQVAKEIRSLPKPVIAVVQGAAAGAGSNLAFVCDFIVAAENAKFAESYIKIGLVPDHGGSQVLKNRVTLSKLNEMLFLGKPLSAQEALAMGAVNTVAAPAELADEVEKLVAQLVALPPIAVAKTKEMINKRAYGDLDAMIDREYAYITSCMLSEDFTEGVAAFLAKRQPEFRGL